MSRSRRVRSPPFDYDPRMMGRPDSRLPPDYDDPYGPMSSFEPPPPAAFVEQPPAHYPVAYRDQRLPSTYRATIRDPYLMPNSPPYKILCITNINPKVSDGPIKEALSEDFSRFGDISVSICHDSGERLAYIYFRSYGEAREARHAKSRTLFFDRPIEIEPIYEPRGESPDESPPPSPLLPQSQTSAQPPLPSQMYPPERHRSLTPPEYYGLVDGPPMRRPLPPQPMPHHPLQEGSPPFNYPHVSRHPQAHSPPMGLAPPMPYPPGGRGGYYMPPAHHMNQHSPYSTPPPDPYRGYHPAHGPPPPDPYLPHGYPPPHPYGPGPPLAPHQMLRERDDPCRPMRSPRHEAYYQMDHRGSYPPLLPPPPPPSNHQSSSRTSSMHPSYPHPSVSPNMHSSSSTSRGPPPPQAPHPSDQPARYMSREYRREKYGNESYGNEPEEGRPSRVLFVNNIDAKKTEEDLRDIFSVYGTIEELEVRKVTSNSSSALIKFSSMDCAYKAKTAKNGRNIGGMRCRITYSKVVASRRLWVGGLGPSTTISCLEDEFGKFGNIISMDYTSGRPYAYVEFETANQAQFATHHIRGTMLAEAERRIRIEYVDPERSDRAPPPPAGKHDTNNHTNVCSNRSRSTINDSWTPTHEQDRDTSPQSNCLKRSISPNLETNSCNKRLLLESATEQQQLSSRLTRSNTRSPPMVDHHHHHDTTSELNNNNQQAASNSFSTPLIDDENSQTEEGDSERIIRAKSIREVVTCCPVAWDGQLVLRNFNFPSRLFMCSGQKTTIEQYLDKMMNDDNQCPVLKITQRWRLHPQPKLEEVKRRMQSGNSGMLIITSRLDQSPSLSSPNCKTPQSSASGQTPSAGKQNGDMEEPASDHQTTAAGACKEGGSSTQARPLKNLISYLEQKDAAGVISLGAVGLDGHPATSGTKLLYAFPPGEFALELLRSKAPNLILDSTTREEFLLGIIVGGIDSSNKI